MSYSIVPVATQSPGLFPAQGQTNFTRLKAIIDRDLNFTDSSTATQGCHKQVTFLPRLDPSEPPTSSDIPPGAISMIYSKRASDLVPEIWYSNDVYNSQLDWRQLSGVLNGTTSDSVPFPNIVTIPPFCYGTVLVFKGDISTPLICSGSFISDLTSVNGYAHQITNVFYGSNVFQFGTNVTLGGGGNGLTLTGRIATNTSGISGTWNYRVFYRKYA